MKHSKSSPAAAPAHHSARVSSESARHGDTTWTNIQDPASGLDLQNLAKTYHLHDLHVHQTIAGGQVSQLAIEKDYLFVLLYQPYQTTTGKIVSTQIGIFLGRDFLITAHSSHTPAPHQLFQDIQAHPGSEAASAPRLVFHLVGRLLSDIKHQTDDISLQLDKLENRIFEDDTSDAVPIGRLRQKIIHLQRTLVAQKTVLEELHEAIADFTHEDLRRYYLSNTNMSRRLWETIEEAKETVEIYKDADFTTSTEQTNRVLAVLTILFTLSIPATVVGAVYGMNIPLPGAVTAHAWTFAGTYSTLYVMLAVSIIPAAIMYRAFKKRHWF